MPNTAQDIGYTSSVRVVKPPRGKRQDLRDLPTYTFSEAARYLAIPKGTLEYWYSGPERLYSPAGNYGTYSLLSFRDMAQAYLIHMLRTHHRVPVAKLRQYLMSLSKETKAKYPLLDPKVKAGDGRMFYDRPARNQSDREVLDLSGVGQFAIGPVIDLYAKRIVNDERDNPTQLFPWRLFVEDQDSQPVSIDPQVMSGQAVVTGTRIPVSILVGMKGKGKSIEKIADTYRLNQTLVEKAIQHFERPVLFKVA